MTNNVLRAQVVLIWCMSIMTIGAMSVVTGADLTLANAGWLSVACILPPAVVLLTWRDPATVAIADPVPIVPLRPIVSDRS